MRGSDVERAIENALAGTHAIRMRRGQFLACWAWGVLALLSSSCRAGLTASSRKAGVPSAAVVPSVVIETAARVGTPTAVTAVMGQSPAGGGIRVPTAALTSTLPTASPTPALPVDPDGRPHFSEVAHRTPADVLAYLRGELPGYPGSGPDRVIDFSPSDILETMDTAWLDEVGRAHGQSGLGVVYETIAHAILATLVDLYPRGWIVLALDAGHGGKKGYYWDPGSEGTEAGHTRAVVAALERLVKRPEYHRVISRRIFNDDLADDFGLPRGVERPTINSTLMRQARASMLAMEANRWNLGQSDPSGDTWVHEISVHFNVGSGGALVLHQGNTVRPAFVERSVEFARRYLARVTGALNATGLLPHVLELWNGDGLHDDIMMYRPAGLAAPQASSAVLRYGALQGHGYLPRYIQTILAHADQTAGGK